MKLKFICSEDFEAAGVICNRIREYLPNLVDSIEINSNNAFKGIFETWEVLPMIDEIIKPDWERDIVIVVIYGTLYLADLELFELVGCTLDYFLLNRDGTTKLYSKVPKIGAQLLPNNMSKEPRADAKYWAKLGVEEILHYFSIPEEHDESCFFHAKAFGKGTVEDCRRDYCPKCREFLRQLKDPLDFDKLLARVEKTYKVNTKPIHSWKENLRCRGQ